MTENDFEKSDIIIPHILNYFRSLNFSGLNVVQYYSYVQTFDKIQQIPGDLHTRKRTGTS
jgi:hypothetical protein